MVEGFEELMALLLQFCVLPSPLCLPLLPSSHCLTFLTLLPSPYYLPHGVFTLPLTPCCPPAPRRHWLIASRDVGGSRALPPA